MRWLDLHIGGQRWGVYLSPKGSKLLKGHDGDRLEGCTYFDTCRIYINKDLGDEALADTLLHELLHASLYVSGGSNVIDNPKKEEQIVLGLTPILHRMLKDLGARLPKR